MVSCRSCWNGWKLPRSSSLILVLWSKDEEADTCERAVLVSGNTTLSHFAICFTEAVVSSGRVEKSPHEQEIKFFAKVRPSFETNVDLCSFEDLSLLWYCKNSPSLKSLSQILMPLINQYFKNHCLYFLSTPAKVLGSGGHSSNKEKEMIARWSPVYIESHSESFCYLLFFSFIIPPFISYSLFS